MPACYIGEHVVISGTLEGGRRLNWVNRVTLTAVRSLPVCPQLRTFSAPVGKSQRCQFRTLACRREADLQIDQRGGT